MTYVIAYDVGTTGVKTCLFSIGETIRLEASAQQGYDPLHSPRRRGGAGRRPVVGGHVRHHPEALYQQPGAA